MEELAAAEIRRLADVARGADPATPVPTCPGWDLADLLRHVGQVNRWAAAMVEQGSQRRLEREELEWDDPDDPAALPDWVAEGAERCRAVFAAADPAFEMWAWGWPKAARFWPRRMLHETGVHRADAEIALGRTPAFEAELAADGVDELLDNLPHAAYFAPAVAELKGDGEVLALATPEASWAITLDPDGFRGERTDGATDGAAATLRAPTAGDLLLTLYRRHPAAPEDISGDPTIVERWLANSAL